MKKMNKKALKTAVAVLGIGLAGVASHAGQADHYEQLQGDFSRNQAKYRELVGKIETTIKEAEERLGGLRSEKNALEADIKTVRQEIFDLKVERESYREEAGEYRKDVEVLEKSVADYQQTMEALRKRLVTMTGDVDALEKALKAQAELEKQQDELNAVTTERDSLASKLAEVQASFSDEIAQLKIRVEKSQEDAQAMEAAGRQAVEDLAVMERRLGKEQDARTVLEEKIAALEEQLSETRESERLMAKENKRIKEEAEDLEHALRGSERIIAGLNSKLEAEEVRVEQLDKENRQLTSSQRKLDKEHQQVLERNSKLQDRVTAQAEQIAVLRSRFEEADKVRVEALAEAQSSRELLENFLSRQETLLDDLDRVRDRLTKPAGS